MSERNESPSARDVLRREVERADRECANATVFNTVRSHQLLATLGQYNARATTHKLLYDCVTDNYCTTVAS